MDANERVRLQDTAESMPGNVVTGSFQRASERAGDVQAGGSSGRVLSFPAQDRSIKRDTSSFSVPISSHGDTSRHDGLLIMLYRSAPDTTGGSIPTQSKRT